jgi:hypothetical protein
MREMKGWIDNVPGSNAKESVKEDGGTFRVAETKQAEEDFVW